MRAGVAFFLAAWAGWIVGAAILVFGMGHIVRPYNVSASFLMLAGYPVVQAAVVGLSAAAGAWGRPVRVRQCTIPAGALGLACALFMILSDYAPKGSMGIGTAIFWAGFPAIAFFATRRLARRAPAQLQSLATDQPADKG